jgi:hypothetical protein
MILLAAIGLITGALVAYSFALIPVTRKLKIAAWTLIVLVLGFIMDLAATGLMVWRASNKGVTMHGLLGYSALVVMLTTIVLLWRSKSRGEILIPRGLQNYIKFAYGWWILTYLVGAMMAMFMRRG